MCALTLRKSVAKIQDGPCVTLRAWATLPGVDLLVATHLFSDLDERLKWDTCFARLQIIQEDVQGSDIMYSLLRVPPTVAARDFVQFRRIRTLEDGSIVIVLRSCEHAGAPKDKNVIRAESLNSGYIFRQTYEQGLPVLKIFITTRADIKGLIPKWIINMMAPRAPKEWVTNLRKAALEYQEKNPGYKEALAGELDKYRSYHAYDLEPAAEESTSNDCRVKVTSPRTNSCEHPQLSARCQDETA